MTFREAFRRRACAVWWRMRHGAAAGCFSVPAEGLAHRHVMIVMPPEFRDFEAALRILTPLLEKMNPPRATIIVRDGFRAWLPSDPRLRFVTFDPAKKNWLGFPPPTLQRAMGRLGADIAVDLTPGFSPFTAALAAATSAPLRISLDDEESNQFFNFHIRLPETRSLPERYAALLRYV